MLPAQHLPAGLSRGPSALGAEPGPQPRGPGRSSPLGTSSACLGLARPPRARPHSKHTRASGQRAQGSSCKDEAGWVPYGSPEFTSWWTCVPTHGSFRGNRTLGTSHNIEVGTRLSQRQLPTASSGPAEGSGSQVPAANTAQDQKQRLGWACTWARSL